MSNTTWYHTANRLGPLPVLAFLALLATCPCSSCSPPDGSPGSDGGPADRLVSDEASQDDASRKDGTSQDAGGYCGNAVVETQLGETCDDGNRIVGDGCDSRCQIETLYEDFVQVRNGRIFIRDNPVFLVGAAWLPQGADERQALAAGFTVLVGSGVSGYRIVPLPLPQSSRDIPAFVSTHEEEGNIIAWLGPDEPAWNGLSASALQSDYSAPVADTDDYDRPFMINHAPRGTTDAPADFDTLLPYVTLSDFVSMDIYPIPEGNGHSNLPDHQGLDAVGAYTEILSGLVTDSGHDQAVIMVIQGAGMGHIPGEGWNNLESWQTDSQVDPTTIRVVEADDFDGDGTDELVLVVQADGQHPDRILVFDFEDHTWAGNRLVDVPVELDLSSPMRSAVGDFDGNGAADLALFVDQASDRQDMWILDGGPSGLQAPRLSLRGTQDDFLVQVIRQAVGGDFDADGCDDILVAYDYPGPDHQTWLLLSSECSGFAPTPPSQAQTWYDGPTSELDMEQILHTDAADIDSDGLTDLIVSRRTASGALQVLRLMNQPSGFRPPQLLFDDPGSTMRAEGHAFMATRDLDGDGSPELLLAQADPHHVGPSTLLVGPLDAEGTYGTENLETWLSKPALDLVLLGAGGAACGDLDGDGLADLVTAAPAQSQPATSLTVAFSTSNDFGARDPLEKEMWFMALDAAVHGASGVVFWAQQFVNADSVVWTRLCNVGRRLAAIEAILASSSPTRNASNGFAWRWYQETEQGSTGFLLACHERREPNGSCPTIPLPSGLNGDETERWNPDSGSFEACPSASLSGGGFTEQSPFGSYECRIYRIR